MKLQSLTLIIFEFTWMWNLTYGFSDTAMKTKLFAKQTNFFGVYDKEEQSEINEWVTNLEKSQSKYKTVTFPDAWKAIQGRWLLRYTNNAQSFQNVQRNSILKSVEQRIIIDANTKNNKSVQHILLFENPVLSLLSSVRLLDSSTKKKSASKIILNHLVQVSSNASPAQLALDLESVEIVPNLLIGNNSYDNKLLNMLNGQAIRIPLIGPSLLRRGFFETTYVDDEIRISRGIFNELRVFQRIQSDETGDYPSAYYNSEEI